MVKLIVSFLLCLTCLISDVLAIDGNYCGGSDGLVYVASSTVSSPYLTLVCVDRSIFRAFNTCTIDPRYLDSNRRINLVRGSITSPPFLSRPRGDMTAADDT